MMVGGMTRRDLEFARTCKKKKRVNKQEFCKQFIITWISRLRSHKYKTYHLFDSWLEISVVCRSCKAGQHRIYIYTHVDIKRTMWNRRRERHFCDTFPGVRVRLDDFIRWYLANGESIVSDDRGQILHLGKSHLLGNHFHLLPPPAINVSFYSRDSCALRLYSHFFHTCHAHPHILRILPSRVIAFYTTHDTWSRRITRITIKI